MTCPMFMRKHFSIRSVASRDDPTEQPPHSWAVVWCAHEVSPLPEVRAIQAANSGDLLTCGGDIARCQVPLDSF